MSSLKVEIEIAGIVKVQVTDKSLSAEMDDGRTISLPLSWYPRLQNGTEAERNNYRIIGGGAGVHWPELDEDISVEALLAGRRSHESQQSLKKWLIARKASV
jgi:hypothetical protein